MLQTNDKSVRTFVCQQMTIATNIIINFYKFNMDRKKFANLNTEAIQKLPEILQKEYQILFFLQFML